MVEDTKRLKMSLKVLRSLINVNKEGWDNVLYTNCYAYALGLDVPQYEICECAYAPGVMSSSQIFLPKYKVFTIDMLL